MQNKSKPKEKKKKVLLEEKIVDLKAMKVSLINWLTKLDYDSDLLSRNHFRLQKKQKKTPKF